MAPPQQLRQRTSNCSTLLIYRPRKDERLSWPSWLTYSGWFTHISGHPSATGRAQDSESTPAKNRCYTAGPRNQLLEVLDKLLSNDPLDDLWYERQVWNRTDRRTKLQQTIDDRRIEKQQVNKTQRHTTEERMSKVILRYHCICCDI